MSNERKVFLQDIGEVNLRKRRGTQRLSLRIDYQGKVRASIPYSVSYREAIRYIELKKDWITTTRQRVMQQSRLSETLISGELPRTRHHEFILTPTAEEDVRCVFSQGLCEIFVPRKMDIRSDDIREFISYCYTEALRKEARVFLVRRVNELAAMHSFTVRNIRIKNLKSRWGSCSSNNNINLNLHLMSLPDHLIDYVILHELVHTRIRNHSRDFWMELDKYMTGSKQLAKEMRNYSPVI